MHAFHHRYVLQDGMERKDLLEKNCGIFKEQVSSFTWF
jgi:malate/lactate dehydrogenase